MKTLSIDIETYSDIPLQKSGVYRYCESPNFEILLFGYSADSGPVQVVDLACGEKIPADVLGYAALAQGLGVVQSDGSAFAPKRIATRAEAAVMIYNLLSR